jgi:hemoglobin
MTTTENLTLFDRLGGESAVQAVVSGLYARIAADPDLAPFFGGVSLRRHEARVAIFVCAATGGQAAWDGRDMSSAHAHLEITDAHFDKVATHLADELYALGVDDAVAAELLAVVGTLRPAIVTR